MPDRSVAVAVSRSATVLEALRGAILSGAFAPGERLHEVRLASRLGSSRTPVRAALQRLHSEGLLDHAPHRGYSVRSFPVSELVGAYDVRAVLEGLAARNAAERGIDLAQRDILERSVADGDRLLAAGRLEEADRAAYAAINAAFHETIHAAGGSRLLGEMIHVCRQVPVSSPHNIVAFAFADMQRRHDDHHGILDAVVRADPVRAESLMRQHVEGVKRSLVHSLQQ